MSAEILDLVLTLRHNSSSRPLMPTVLYIDDVPQALALRKTILEGRGYRVLTASDGPSGIEIARRRSVEVVLLDYDMPGMMGDEVAGILKSQHPNLPIIILAGSLFSVPETLLRSCDGCVQKREGPTVLLETVEQVLKRRHKPMKPPKDEAKAG